METLTRAAKKTQRHRQKHQRMQRRPQYERQPDPKVIDLENLTAGESQDENPEELRHRDPAENAAADIHERRPGSGLFPSEPPARAVEDGSRGDSVSASDMSAELDADADADDDVDETDGVERDVGESHRADDVRDDHCDGDGDDETCCHRAEEEGNDEEDES